MHSVTDTPTLGAISHRPRRQLALDAVTLAACAAALFAASPARAVAEDVAATSIAYSDTYNRLLAAFPSGYADSCDASVALHRSGGICDARIDFVYFYPDGTVGKTPWYFDASSSSGWSSEADPCDGLTSEDYELWAGYVDYVNGYFDSGPGLTSVQIGRYGACWGWWF